MQEKSSAFYVEAKEMNAFQKGEDKDKKRKGGKRKKLKNNHKPSMK